MFVLCKICNVRCATEQDGCPACYDLETKYGRDPLHDPSTTKRVLKKKKSIKLENADA